MLRADASAETLSTLLTARMHTRFPPSCINSR